MKKLNQWLQGLWHFIYNNMVTRSRLPVPSDLESEQLKINVLRIVLGIVVCWRTALITCSAYYYYPAQGFLGCPSEFWFSLLCLTLAICMTVGFLTPFSTLALLVLYNQMDAALSTMTLGTNLLTLCLFFLLFTNAGSKLSIDGLNLGNPNSRLYPITSFLYKLMGFPSRDQIRGYCWLLFMAYAVTSLGAVSLHIGDEFWRRGQTVALMLQNSFLCHFWQAGRSVAEHFPVLVSAFSVFACIGQAIFQMFMMPLVYTRWGVWFVGLWGAAFALISLVLLQISYIPQTEAVLWALVFCPAGLFTGLIDRLRIRRPVLTRPLPLQSGTFCASVSMATIMAFVLVIVVASGHHIHSVKLLRKAVKYLGPPLYNLGLDVPDVFNQLDLATDRCWYVMARRDADGSISDVPASFKEGNRGYYHYFDTLYFSNFVPWRRMMGLYGGDLRDLLAPDKPGYALIRRVVEFDRKLDKRRDASEYLVTVYVSGGKGADVVASLTFPGKNRLARSAETTR